MGKGEIRDAKLQSTQNVEGVRGKCPQFDFPKTDEKVVNYSFIDCPENEESTESPFDSIYKQKLELFNQKIE